MQEKVMNLFTNIDEEITNQQISIGENLIKIAYLLKDNQIYYAMFPKEEQLMQELSKFKTLPTLQLSSVAVKEALELVLQNTQVFYQLQEFLRYLKRTNEVEKVKIYEATYASMQQNLLVQLQFLASLSPLLHGQSSPSFPNLTYQGNAPSEFYQQCPPRDEKEAYKQYLIMNVLVGDNPSSITTEDVLKTLYLPNELLALHQLSVMETNTNKLNQYIATRKEEYQLLEKSDAINITMTKENVPLFKDVNTVFDLHMAALISDKVYKKGQGVFAISDYILTGKTIRFTSKYGARELAMTVNYQKYKNLLLYNVLVDFASFSMTKKSTEKMPLYEKLTELLQSKAVTLEDVSNLLANNMLLLTLAVDYFNYEYLNPTGVLTQILASLEKEPLDPMRSMVKQLLEQLRLS